MNGIELAPFIANFSNRKTHAQKGGIISSIPVIKVDDEKQNFDISTLMRSLNGQNYTVLFIARPHPVEWVQDRYNKVLEIRDN